MWYFNDAKGVHTMNQFYNQDEEVQKAVKAMFDFIEAMNKLDSKHQQQVLNEGIKAEMLKSILKMQ